MESEAVNALSWQAQSLFLRLMLKADDFGRYTADARLVRAALFPLQLDQVREADASRWIAECVKTGLVRLYSCEGKTYLEIRKFDQRLRAKKSKFPEPPPDFGDPNDGHASDTRPADDWHMLPEEISKGSRRDLEHEGAPEGAVSRPASSSDRFQEFWNLYPKKSGKVDAEKAWKKLSDTDRALAIERASAYASAMVGREEFIKNAQGWLNGRRWEDDPTAWGRNGGTRPSNTPAPRELSPQEQAVLDAIPPSRSADEMEWHAPRAPR